MTDTAQSQSEPHAAHGDHKGSLRLLMLGALGVVYGDIGTSPLYAVRECFHSGIEPNHDNVLGVLSLITWSLIVVVSIKYMVFVMRADNKGEGGILSLMALVLSGMKKRQGTRYGAVIILGLFGGALLYSDGAITPAISILGAIEGIAVLQPDLERYVVAITVAILFGLFLVQRHGTARLGGLFGPIIVIWFLTIAGLGVAAIIKEPETLLAVNPLYGLQFLRDGGWTGFVVMGSVFLVVTGGEALYADMGHFGRRPIQLDWFTFVLPALLLNYYGQGALLLTNPDAIVNPFFELAPRWGLIPLIVLATLAAIIASQAVISGAFSLTRQAVLLGYLPRIRVVHTSSRLIGQIYVPSANWALMAGTIGVVLGFQTSSNVGAAYGVAITTTMLFTTMLLFIVARNNWGWPLKWALPLCLVFLVFDLAFFSAALLKVVHGGWFPLLVSLIVFVIMYTWRQGRTVLASRLGEDLMTLETFVENITQGDHQPARVPGAAVFMTANPNGTPRALGHNIRHNKVIHDRVVALTVTIAEEPYVPREKRVVVKDIGRGFYRVTATYGFMESPSVPEILELAGEKGLNVPMFGTAFFLGRENIRVTKRKDMAPWRQRLFSFLARNAQSATDFYEIPANQVIELGLQVEL